MSCCVWPVDAAEVKVSCLVSVKLSAVNLGAKNAFDCATLVTGFVFAQHFLLTFCFPPLRQGRLRV